MAELEHCLEQADLIPDMCAQPRSINPFKTYTLSFYPFE